MATLYELQGSYAHLQQMIEDGETDLDGILSTVEDAIETKLESYAMVIKNIESDVAGLKAEEKRLGDKRKTMENNIKRMKLAMHEAMSSTGEKKIKGEKFTFTIQKNPSALKLLDESLIPKIYVTTTTVNTIDKKRIMERLKADEEVPGAELSQGESLRIR